MVAAIACHPVYIISCTGYMGHVMGENWEQDKAALHAATNYKGKDDGEDEIELPSDQVSRPVKSWALIKHLARFCN